MFWKVMTKAEFLALACVASDSGLSISKCWCAECASDRRGLRGQPMNREIEILVSEKQVAE